jgi:hypothetical protein
MSEKKNVLMGFLDDLCSKFGGDRKALGEFLEDRYERIKSLSTVTLSKDYGLTDVDSLLFKDRISADKGFILHRLRFIQENIEEHKDIVSWSGPECLWKMPTIYWDNKDFIMTCIMTYPNTYYRLAKYDRLLRYDDDVIEIALKSGYRDMFDFPLCTNMAKAYVRCKLNPRYQVRLEARISKKFADSGMDFVTYYERNILKKSLSKKLDKKQAPKRVNKI